MNRRRSSASFVQTLEPRPNGTSLATAIASSRSARGTAPRPGRRSPRGRLATRRDVGQHGGRVVGARPASGLPAGEHARARLRPRRSTWLDELLELGRASASGPTSVAGSIGSPTFSAAMRRDERRARTRRAIASCTMKRFAAMQDWPLLMVRAVHGGLHRRVEVRARHHDERIAPAELEHGLLDDPARGGRDRRARRLAPGERRRPRRGRSSRMRCDARRSRRAASGTRPRGNPASRKTSSMASAHCGTFDACLSSPTLPAISAGAAKRNTCQNGKFQGMTARTGPIGRNRTNDRVAEAFTSSSARKRSRVLGVVAADPGALLRLPDRGPEGLAHLERHRARPVLLPAIEHVAGTGHERRALGDRPAAPRGERVGRAGEPRLELGVGQLVEAGEDLTGGGVHGRHRGHEIPSFPRVELRR